MRLSIRFSAKYIIKLSSLHYTKCIVKLFIQYSTKCKSFIKKSLNDGKKIIYHYANFAVLEILAIIFILKSTSNWFNINRIVFVVSFQFHRIIS